MPAHRALPAVRLLCLAALLLFAACAAAVPVGPDDGLVLGPHASYLEDPGGAMNLNQARQAAAAGQFRPLQAQTPNFGFSDSAYWLKVDLLPRSERAGEWLLQVANPGLEHIGVTLLQGTHGQSYATGIAYPFAQRPIPHSSFLFPLHLEPGQPAQLYLRVQSGSTLQLPLTLWSRDGFLAEDARAQLGYGLFFGVLLAMLMYNGFLASRLREASYLYYILFVGAFLGYQVALRGYGYAYLWPEQVWLNQHMPALTIGLSALFALQFCRNFLQVPQRLPQIDAWLRAVLLLAGAVSVYALVADRLSGLRFATLVAPAAAIAMLAAVVLSWRRGVREARFLLLAWSALLIGAVITAATYAGLLPATFLTTHAALVGSLLDVVLLSFALGDRIQQEREARDQAQRAMLEARQQSVEHLQRYREVFDNAAEGLFQCRPDGRLLAANPALAALFGYPSGEAMVAEGANLADYLGAPEQWARVAERLQASGALRELELRYRNRHGVEAWAALTLRRSDEQLWDGSWVDVSDRKARETSERQRQSAEAAARAKGEFLANMSHEIRTPLNAVVGFADLALREYDPQVQREYLEKIRGASDSLLLIIDDVLDASRLEAGKLELDRAEFDLDELLERQADLLAPLAAEKGLELVVSRAPQVPASLVGDPTRLQQVLTNLLNNALKFTGGGEVELRVSLVEHRGQLARLHFAVRDTGIGIPPERLPNLFTPFTQAESSTSRHYGGTGLGLHISRSLVELMGGRIWVESRPGKGSTFQFDLTLATGTPATAAGPVLHLLALTEQPALERLLADVAGQCGWRLELCHDVDEALRRLQQTRPDLVLVDLPAPRLAAQAAQLVEAGGAPVLAAVPFGHRHIRRWLEQAGVQRYLEKPVTRGRLLRAASDLLEGPAASGGPTAGAATPAALTGMQVLLVEDNALNQELAKLLLEEAGVRVHAVGGGAEAVAAAAEQRFDAVLMDIQMPGMDGYEATQRIRRGPQANVPVIALSANVLPRDQERAYRHGMQDYLRKPIDREALYAALLRWRGRTALAAEATRVEERRVEAVFEPEQALRRLGGRHELLLHLLRGFRRDYGGDHPLFELAPGAQLEREVHTLKGLADSLGLPRLQAAAASWEQVLRAGGESSAAREQTREQLEQALAALARADADERADDDIQPGGGLA